MLLGTILASVGAVVNRSLHKDEIALLDALSQVWVLLLVPRDNSVPLSGLDQVT